MTTIALYNIKGGVGKTAAAVNLSYLATTGGKKVLVWDLDPQGAASFYFQSQDKLKGGIKKMLSHQSPLQENIYATNFENLWLVPADLGNRHLDIVIEEVKQSKKKLRSMISEVEHQYDYLFLDCPPGLGSLSEAIFAIADIVLMPAIPTTLSIRTYDMVKSFFDAHELKMEKIKCFFNMVDVRKNLHNEVVNKFYNHKDFFRNYIPYLSTIEKMGVHVGPVVSFAPNSYATECFRELWKELKRRMN